MATIEANDLEVKLQCKLNYSATALVLDLAEVVDGVLREAEPACWIANVSDVPAITVRTTESAITDRIQCQEDVTVIRVCGRDVNPRRIRLVEYVEEPGPELNLLFFSDVEVLEE